MIIMSNQKENMNKEVQIIVYREPKNNSGVEKHNNQNKKFNRGSQTVAWSRQKKESANVKRYQ